MFDLVPYARRKKLRRKCRDMAKVQDWGLIRPKTCLDILGVPSDCITPRSFVLARQAWIEQARKARREGEQEIEVAINLAWQALKSWRCPVCGNCKSTTKTKSCGPACGRQLIRESARRQHGPIILRMDAAGKGNTTGTTFVGHALRRAQYNCLKQHLEKANWCVTEAAKSMGMAKQTCNYYIRKFGGFPAMKPETQTREAAA